MDRTEMKEGILCLLEDSRGRTLEEIREFLELNGVKKYSGEDSEEELKGLLAEMQEEGLLEERFMVDGSDAIDFAIEEDGKEFLKTCGNAQGKWNTGRQRARSPAQENAESMEGME